MITSTLSFKKADKYMYIAILCDILFQHIRIPCWLRNHINKLVRPVRNGILLHCQENHDHKNFKKLFFVTFSK